MQLTSIDFQAALARAGGRAVTEETNAAPTLPLTAAQLSIWIDQALHPRKPVYNTGQIVRINTRLDRAAFEQALRVVVAKHDALRLRLYNGPEIRQVVQPEVNFNLFFEDFSASSQAEADAEKWLMDEFWRPLGPTDSPLFVFCLAKLSANHFLWLQKYHHLVIDATGRQIVAKDMADAYNSIVSRGEIPMAEAPSYADAVASDEAYRQSDQYALDR